MKLTVSGTQETLVSLSFMDGQVMGDEEWVAWGMVRLQLWLRTTDVERSKSPMNLQLLYLSSVLWIPLLHIFSK